MARYIDSDRLSFYFNALAEHAEMEGLLNMAHIHRRCLQMIEDEPTADVVPKSEVDLYRKQVDELEDELSLTYDKLEKAKADVANEIFDAIYKLIDDCIIISDDRRYFQFDKFKKNIAELKKKYIGDTDGK